MRHFVWPFLLLLTIPAHGAEYLTLEPPACVAEIAGTEQSGISTGALAERPLVRTCDGAWRTIALADEGLRLGDEAPVPTVPVPEDSLRLSDGELTLGKGPIASAWLVGPTQIYAHGILGDATEASGVRVELNDGTHRERFLDSFSVFEDLRARLVDLTGDGRDEIVVIRSRLDSGASLAVFGLTAGGLSLLGENPAIGLANRWLNPAGAADFDGDGVTEIALVETPHIGGTLRVFSLHDGQLLQEAEAAGFSNHAIGSRLLDLSAVLDWNDDGRPDLAVPNARRTALKIMTLDDGQLVELTRQSHGREIVSTVLATDLDRDGRPELLYALDDGETVALRPR